MNLRVPANVPTGKAYQLIDIKPSKVGGLCVGQAVDRWQTGLSRSRRSHHQARWRRLVDPRPQIGGPLSGVGEEKQRLRRKGSIRSDRDCPSVLDLPPALTRAVDLIADEKWGQAYAELQKSPDKDRALRETLASKMNSNLQAHVERIGKLAAAGDLCGIYTHFQPCHDLPRHPAYDEILINTAPSSNRRRTSSHSKQPRIPQHDHHRQRSLAGECCQLDALEKFAKTHKAPAHRQGRPEGPCQNV